MTLADNKPRRLGRPPKAEGRDTRRQILEAALDLFSTDGYDGTSIKQIAEQVGLRDSALYGHFGSKAEIRTELFHTFGPVALHLELEKLDVKSFLLRPASLLTDVL